MDMKFNNIDDIQKLNQFEYCNELFMLHNRLSKHISFFK